MRFTLACPKGLITDQEIEYIVTCGKDGQSCPVTCGMPSALVSKLTVGGEN